MDCGSKDNVLLLLTSPCPTTFLVALATGEYTEDKIHGRNQLKDRMSEVSPCICYTYFHQSALAPHQGGFSQVHGETNTEYLGCSVLEHNICTLWICRAG